MPTIEPTIRRRSCRKCETLYVEPFPYENSWPKGYCSEDCYKAKKRAEKPAPRRTEGLVTKPSKKPARPISIASTEQAAKRNTGASIVSGETRGLHMAHICPRALGGCDDPDCAVPMTPAEHRAFDNPDHRTGKRLDLLPYLVAQGCHAELSHALWHYRLDLVALLERVTGEKWGPSTEDQTRGKI